MEGEEGREKGEGEGFIWGEEGEQLLRRRRW